MDLYLILYLNFVFERSGGGLFLESAPGLAGTVAGSRCTQAFLVRGALVWRRIHKKARLRSQMNTSS